MNEINTIDLFKEDGNSFVSYDVNCAINTFEPKKKDKKFKSPKQEIRQCTVIASVDTGTVSISLRENNLMVSIRLDEMMSVIAEALKKNKKGDVDNASDSKKI